MRAVWIVIGCIAAAGAIGAQPAARGAAANAADEDPTRLVREVVYNELHDHASHGFFRYWIERNSNVGTTLEEQIETADGPLTRVVESNGHPLSVRDAQQEEVRLDEMLHSPSQQAQQRAAYVQDEQRITRILQLLPDAFVYQDTGTQDGVRRLRFTPNPSYSAHGIEARVFHCLSGELWVDLRDKRMRRLEGHLDSDVEFGFGLLGRVYMGSSFLMIRTPVTPTDWKTDQFELHVSGRALLFKTLARNTSEKRGGFSPVPSKMTLAQGLKFLESSDAIREAAAHVAPLGLGAKHE